jgi:hypothetical protein
MPGVRTALNVEAGMELLRELVSATRMETGDDDSEV